MLPGLLPYLTDSFGEEVTASQLAAYVVAVVGHSAFTERFAEELLTPGVRIPLTRNRVLWHRAVALGKEVLWASTYGERYADPSGGRPGGKVEFAPGDSRQVRYLTPIGSAVPDRLSYDGTTQTLNVGAGSFAPVPEAVWAYEVGGMRIVTKWFGYRKASPTSKRTSPLDDIHAANWPYEWTTELIELLSVLRRLTDWAVEQSELTEEILAAPVLTQRDLAAAGLLPVPVASRRARRSATDALFTEQDVT